MSEPRRSGRSLKRVRDEVPSWAKAGLPGLIKGNEASLCKMLDAKGLDEAAILAKLVEVRERMRCYEPAEPESGRSPCSLLQHANAQRLRERTGQIPEGQHGRPSGENQLTLAKPSR
eukprot:4568196-Pyramimonas_sp.AAC.1